MHYSLFIIFILATTRVVLGEGASKPMVIDDQKLNTVFEEKMAVHADSGKFPTLEKLKASLEDLPKFLRPTHPFKLEKPSELKKQKPVDAVFILGTVYDCGKCDRWHKQTISTAWALSEDGLMMSNYHVFDRSEGDFMGVMDRHGNAYPVVAVLAGCKDRDICLFRVKTSDKLTTLAMGEPASVGDEVHVISHPRRRYFSENFGKVNRYFHRRRIQELGKADWMTIDADFAVGSSGGPVLDMKGNVVGMVSFTESFQADSDKDKENFRHQMTLKNCVPVWNMKSFFPATEEQYSEKP